MPEDKSRPQPVKLLLVLGVLGLLVALLAAGVLVLRQREAAASVPSGPAIGVTEYRGTVVEPPLPLTDFTLPASTGAPLSLSDLRGRWVLLFFGFTHCPDICPTTLTEYRRIVDALGEDAERLQVVLVSVDPERDTPERLRDYVTRFNPGFIGLQGLPDTLAQMQPEFGMRYEIVREGDSYTVDHSARTYLIDPQGQLRITYAFGTERDVLTDSIRQFLTNAAL